jgi:hypothetical protein
MSAVFHQHPHQESQLLRLKQCIHTSILAAPLLIKCANNHFATTRWLLYDPAWALSFFSRAAKRVEFIKVGLPRASGYFRGICYYTYYRVQQDRKTSHKMSRYYLYGLHCTFKATIRMKTRLEVPLEVHELRVGSTPVVYIFQNPNQEKTTTTFGSYKYNEGFCSRFIKSRHFTY